MRKIMHWMLTAILCICGASIFTSCSNDNSDNPADAETGAPAIEGLAEKMMGKWTLADLNGKPAPTNSKFVTTFTSATKGPAPARGRLDLHRHVPDGESGMMAD